MNLNLFTWIREGVKQAVLHGVSDAVGHIGSRPDGDDVQQRLLEVIRASDALVAQQSETPAPSKPKRLGRSLEQLASEKAS